MSRERPAPPTPQETAHETVSPFGRIRPGTESVAPVLTGLEEVPSVAAFLDLERFFRENRLRENFGPGFADVAGAILPEEPTLKAKIEELAEAYTQATLSSRENLEAMLRFIELQPDAGIRQIAFIYFLTWGGSRKPAPNQMHDPALTGWLLAQLEDRNKDWYIRSTLASAVYNTQSSFALDSDSVNTFKRVLAQEVNLRVGLHLVWTLSNNFKQPEAREVLKGLLADIDTLSDDPNFDRTSRGMMIKAAASAFVDGSHIMEAETSEIARNMLRSKSPGIRQYAANFMYGTTRKPDPSRPATPPEVIAEIGSLLELAYRGESAQKFVHAARSLQIDSLDAWVPMVAGDETLDANTRLMYLSTLSEKRPPYKDPDLAHRMARSFAATSESPELPAVLRRGCVSASGSVIRANSTPGDPMWAGELALLQQAIRAAQSSGHPELRDLPAETLEIAGLQSPPR